MNACVSYTGICLEDNYTREARLSSGLHDIQPKFAPLVLITLPNQGL